VDFDPDFSMLSNITTVAAFEASVLFGYLAVTAKENRSGTGFIMAAIIPLTAVFSLWRLSANLKHHQEIIKNVDYTSNSRIFSPDSQEKTRDDRSASDNKAEETTPTKTPLPPPDSIVADPHHSMLIAMAAKGLKQNTPILVETTGLSGDRLRVANALCNELRFRHFPLVLSENDAALFVNIASASISVAAAKDANDRLNDRPGHAASYASTILKIRATWVDKSVFLDQYINSGKIRGDYNNVENESFEKAIESAAGRFIITP